MAVYFAPVRRELAAKGFSKATIDALESLGATAPSAVSGSWLPLVTGAEPPVFVTDGAGSLIAVAFDD